MIQVNRRFVREHCPIIPFVRKSFAGIINH